jgi:hypothetical protein
VELAAVIPDRPFFTDSEGGWKRFSLGKKTIIGSAATKMR